MIDEEDIQIEPTDAAFTSSKRGHELFGAELKKYSPSRKVAAQSMGLRWPVVGEDAIEQFETTGIYAGMLKDTIVVLWLCSVENSEVMRADRKPQEAYAKALEWADALGIINVSGSRFGEACTVFSQIMQDVSASQFQVESGGGEESGNV